MSDLHPDRHRAGKTAAILNELEHQEDRVCKEIDPLVYRELNKIALGKLRFESKGLTLNATAIVHEAYVNLSSRTDLRSRIQWQSRANFMAVASPVMKRLLIDYAESRNALKRGNGVSDHKINDIPPAIDNERADEILSLDDALTSLAKFDKNGAQMVEYRFFGGLNQKEIAEVMGINERAVRRQWVVAKSWIKRELGEGL